MLTLYTATTARLCRWYQSLTCNHVDIRPLTKQIELTNDKDVNAYLTSHEVHSQIHDEFIDFAAIIQLISNILDNIVSKANDVNDIVFIDVECAKIIGLTQFIASGNNKKEFNLFLCHLISLIVILNNKLLKKEKLIEIFENMEQPLSINLFDYDYFDDSHFHRFKTKYYEQEQQLTYKAILPHCDYISSLTQQITCFVEPEWYSFCHDISLIIHNSFYFFPFFLTNIIKKHMHASDRNNILFEMDKLTLNVQIYIDTPVNKAKLAHSIRIFYCTYCSCSHLGDDPRNFLHLLAQIRLRHNNETYDSDEELRQLLLCFFAIEEDEFCYIPSPALFSFNSLDTMLCDTAINKMQRIFEQVIIPHKLLQNLHSYVYIIQEFGSMLNGLISPRYRRCDTINALFEHIYPKYIYPKYFTMKQLKFEFYDSGFVMTAPWMQYVIHHVIISNDRQKDLCHNYKQIKKNMTQFQDLIIAINHYVRFIKFKFV